MKLSLIPYALLSHHLLQTIDTILFSLPKFLVLLKDPRYVTLQKKNFFFPVSFYFFPEKQRQLPS